MRSINRGTPLRRAILLAAVAAVIPACGGTDAPPAPVTLLSDDFSSLTNWTVSGTVTNPGAVGNPAPAMSFGATDSRATSVDDFNFTTGLTLSFDATASSSGLSAFGTPYGGINSGTSASPAQGAGFVLINSTHTNLILNGSVVSTVTGSWALKNYKVRILPDGRVEYYINGGLVFTSVGTASFTSPRAVLFQGGPFGSFLVDNVLVTRP